jgi:hypothetical protein
MRRLNQDAVWIITDAVDACSNGEDPDLEAALAKLLGGQTLTAVEYVDLRRAVITELDSEERDAAKALLDAEWDKMASLRTPRPELSQTVIGL